MNSSHVSISIRTRAIFNLNRRNWVASVCSETRWSAQLPGNRPLTVSGKNRRAGVLATKRGVLHRFAAQANRSGTPLHSERDGDNKPKLLDEDQEQIVIGFPNVTILSNEPIPDSYVPKRGNANPLIQLAIWGGTVLAFVWISSLFGLLLGSA